MDEVNDFLRSKGIDTRNIVIYNMNNPTNPRIDIQKWLTEFKTIIENQK